MSHAITSSPPAANALPAPSSSHASGPSPYEVLGRRIVVSGRWLKVARIFDEPWLDLPPIENPEGFVQAVRDTGIRADLFTFAQHLPEVEPKYAAEFVEWDNVAAAPSADFNRWWESLPQESRKNTRRASKKGITVRPATFDDEFVAGIKRIYDETPLRQGRKFWHYGKDLATIKRENSSYLDRSQFIGAYLDGQLIGFIKMVFVGPTARIMQILSMNQHFDKYPANALVAAAMEACAKRPVDYFIYGQYVYGTKANSSITEFKRRNGFVQILLPRYYLPFTPVGRAALSARLHRGIAHSLPEPVVNFLLDTRSRVYDRLHARSKSDRPAKGGAGTSE